MRKQLSVKKYEIIYRSWLKKLFQKFGELTDIEIKKAIQTDKSLSPEIIKYFYEKINFKIIDEIFLGVLNKNSEYLDYIIKEKYKKNRPDRNLFINKLILETIPQTLKFRIMKENEIRQKRITFFEGEKDLIASDLTKSFETRKNQLETFRDSFLFNNPEKFETFKEKYPLPEYNFTNSMGRTEINNLNRDLSCSISTTLGATKFEWLTSQDERVRESHRKLNGLFFDYADMPVEYNDYNCRCTLLPVLDSIEGF